MEENIQDRNHFDEVVATYSRTRPDYPVELFSDILDYAGTADCKKAIEIGAGTGKATKPFLDIGYDITAIEISSNMVDFLTKEFSKYDKFEVLNAPFEDAMLDSDKYDLIYAATAFHWVNAEIGCPKTFQLLKSGGVFALFRYNAVPADNGDLYEEIQTVYEKYYHKPYIRPTRKAKDDYSKQPEIIKGFGFDDLNKFRFTDVTIKLYESVWTFSADDYMSLLDTYPDHKSLKDGDRMSLYNGIKDAILRHGGQIDVNYVFQLYMGRKCNILKSDAKRATPTDI